MLSQVNLMKENRLFFAHSHLDQFQYKYIAVEVNPTTRIFVLLLKLARKLIEPNLKKTNVYLIERKKECRSNHKQQQVDDAM